MCWTSKWHGTLSFLVRFLPMCFIYHNMSGRAGKTFQVIITQSDPAWAQPSRHPVIPPSKPKPSVTPEPHIGSRSRNSAWWWTGFINLSSSYIIIFGTYSFQKSHMWLLYRWHLRNFAKEKRVYSTLVFELHSLPSLQPYPTQTPSYQSVFTCK